MSRVVAVDTSTPWGSVALVQTGNDGLPQIVGEWGLRVEGAHGDRILARIGLLLAEAGWSRDDPDAYVATRGPGSFTGLRVGLGTARGLALAAGRRCAGIGTLMAIAEAHGVAARTRVVLMDAGRGELYVEVFEGDSSPPRPRAAASLVARGDLARLVEGTDAVVVPAPGTAIDPLDLPASWFLASAPRGIAAAAGSIAILEGLSAIDDASLAPLYVRQPDALSKQRT